MDRVVISQDWWRWTEARMLLSVQRGYYIVDSIYELDFRRSRGERKDPVGMESAWIKRNLRMQARQNELNHPRIPVK